MRSYPAFLRLDGRPCVVIGGGRVAAGKVDGLLVAGARVTVVSPDLAPPLAAAKARRAFHHEARVYRRGDLKGYVIAVAATADEVVNREIAVEAEAEGVLLNVVDRPELCSFISPAVVRRGRLTLAVSTGGASPMAARRIREHLERDFGAEYGPYLEILRRVRRELSREGWPPDERRRVFAALADSPLLDHLRRGDWPAVERLLRESLGPAVSVDVSDLSASP
jgi:precorrin-2 dehydrogenase/sirohydrochlorin ferrochelatase